MRKLAAITGAFFLAALPVAHAIVIDGGNGTQNFTAPGPGQGGDPGFANVGNNGVYLGNYGGSYWVLTATHVGAHNITLNGGSYSAVGGSAVTVLNGDNSPTDLTLYRIASDPGLPTLNLFTGPNPANNAVVRLMGGGLKESAFTQWDITTNPGLNDDTWTVVGSGGDKAGYTTTGGTGIRWGDAIVVGSTSYNVGTGNTSAFVTGFFDLDGNSMAQSGDSGCATFYYSGDTWYLAGILGAIGTYGSGQSPDHQPGNTAVYGNVTLSVSIPTYYSFIADTIGIAAIPEPSTYAVMAGLLALGAVAARRRKTA